jgi:tetratricopeptide (TPR) repeat protein
MKSILSILTLVLILNISNSVAAIEGTCIQGNCNNGYGKINLLDGREIKCEVVNDEIQVDESTKQLWIKETNSEIEEYIVYLKIGDVYREHRNYEKSLEYYNKSLEIYPNYIEAINNKNDVKKKIAEQEAKAKAQAPTNIVLEGSVRPRTKLYGSSSTSTTKEKSSGKATANSERRYQVPDKVNRLMKSGFVLQNSRL